jgi:hypothetical protein
MVGRPEHGQTPARGDGGSEEPASVRARPHEEAKPVASVLPPHKSHRYEVNVAKVGDREDDLARWDRLEAARDDADADGAGKP